MEENQNEPIEIAFDLDAFLADKRTERRVEDVVLDFDVMRKHNGGVAPVWKVRNLTGVEAARVQQAVDNRVHLMKALSKVGDKDAFGFVEAMGEKLGYGDDDPEDFVRRLHYIRYGLVEPVPAGVTGKALDNARHRIGKQLAERCAPAFYLVTSAIGRLTGLGDAPGK